jgi:serine/threonine protein kinase
LTGLYSVTAKIGAGGMGEVCQARDTKLNRDVSLKVLPEAFTSDPDRPARFEREAKVLASSVRRRACPSRYLASHSTPSWNRLAEWFQQVQDLEGSGLFASERA